MKEKSSHVEITFPPVSKEKISFEAHFLDTGLPDDRIVAETLKFRASSHESEVVLLTHDTNPILTAKRCGLATELIPDEWLLDPEPDPRDREIAQLQEELRAFKASAPGIELSAYREDGRRLKSLELKISEFRVLTTEEVERLVARLVQKYPMAKHFDAAQDSLPHRTIMAGLAQWKYRPAAQEDIDKYQRVAYPRWVDAVRQFFTSLAGKLGTPERYANLCFRISNKGYCPAEHLTVAFRALGGLVIAPPNQPAKPLDTLTVPDPPTPPKGKWVGKPIDDSLRQAMEVMNRPKWQPFLPSLPSVPDIVRPVSRDRHSFYWRQDKPSNNATVWEFECEEFRHKANPEDFQMSVYIPAGQKVDRCAIACVVSAANLPNHVN